MEPIPSFFGSIAMHHIHKMYGQPGKEENDTNDELPQ